VSSLSHSTVCISLCAVMMQFAAIIDICALCSIVDNVCDAGAMYSNARGVATNGVCVQCWHWKDGSVCSIGLGHVSSQSY
jgi:hypothetical protein